MNSLAFTANVSLQILRKRPPEEIARWCVPRVQRLGPVYVKFTQFLSVRRDLFNEGVLAELAKSQQDCDELAMTQREVMDVLVEEHGVRFVSEFKEISVAPIGIASLGQVHRAVARDGRVMAVKVLKRLTPVELESSFLHLRVLAGVADLVNPSNTLRIVEEYREMLYNELDYQQEAMNARHMRDLFRDTPWVKVPEVYFASSRTIGYEYVPGIEVTNLDELSDRFDTAALARRIYTMYLKQVFEFGYFHADLHPGNVRVTDDGDIIMYDYGMMGEISPFLRESFSRLATALYTKDESLLVLALQDLRIVRKGADVSQVRAALDVLLGLMVRGAGEGLSKEAVQRRLMRVPREEFDIPAELVFWFRSAAFVQSLVLQLNPSHDFEEPLKSVLPKMEIPKAIMQAGNAAYKLEKSAEQVKDSLDSLEEIREEISVLKWFLKAAVTVFIFFHFV